MSDRLTLDEWCKSTGTELRHTSEGTPFVVCRRDSPDHIGLWTLADYKVSSNYGNVVFLVPAAQPEQHPKVVG